MSKIFLALNSGSSSLKAAAFELDHAKLQSGQLPLLPHLWSSGESLDLQTANVEQCQLILEKLLASFEKVTSLNRSAIQLLAHRVVHGGAEMTQTVKITDETEARIESLCELAPIHNPIALKIIRASKSRLPGVPSFAVFDTAFHSTLPKLNYVYPTPYEWHEKWGIRRFGFHGINHRYCFDQLDRIIPDLDKTKLRIITCHLGNGCSLAAIHNGISVDTTMGFTPLEGLMMGARSGSIDPGIIFYLISQKNISPETIELDLNNHSGLLGVSGISKDLRKVQESMTAGNDRAKLAFDLFVLRTAKEAAAMTVTLGGVDVLIFTGGIGEHSSAVREAVCDRLNFLGLKLDKNKNEFGTGDDIISTPESSVRILRIAANEEFAMFHEVWKIINQRN